MVRCSFVDAGSSLALHCPSKPKKLHAGEEFHDASDEYPMTPRTKLKRYAKRAVYDREVVHAILDEAFVCHVGFVVEEQPYVLPMAYGRVGDVLYM